MHDEWLRDHDPQLRQLQPPADEGRGCVLRDSNLAADPPRRRCPVALSRPNSSALTITVTIAIALTIAITLTVTLAVTGRCRATTDPSTRPQRDGPHRADADRLPRQLAGEWYDQLHLRLVPLSHSSCRRRATDRLYADQHSRRRILPAHHRRSWGESSRSRHRTHRDRLDSRKHRREHNRRPVGDRL